MNTETLVPPITPGSRYTHGPNETTISIEVVTPGIAEAWLALVPERQRSTNDIFINKLAAHMKAGTWRFNGDTIRFTRSGALIDGQHRLRAIVRSGLPQSMIVVRGLGEEAFETIDVGRPRTVAQLINVSKNAGTIGSAVTTIMRLRDSGWVATKNTLGGVAHLTKTDIANYWNDQVDELLSANAEEWAARAVRIGRSWTWKGRASAAALLLGAYLIARKRGVERADQFLSDAEALSVAGMPVEEGNPLRTLANSQLYGSGSTSRLAMLRAVRCAIDYRDGKKVKVYRLDMFDREGGFSVD